MSPLTLSAGLRQEQALASGRWVKLIVGASNQDVAAAEDLAGIHTLAGVHCIDLAADPAVVAAARRGIAWAVQRGASEPWLMLSLSDGADPHFRKAWFDPGLCPPDCTRPCERVCPALAIAPAAFRPPGAPGVMQDRCYGCGRCLPACPHGLIGEREQVLPPGTVPPLLATLAPEVIELHTRGGRGEAFAERLAQLQESRVGFSRVAVSCGLEVDAAGDGASPVGAAGLTRLVADLWERFALLRRAGYRPLWQLDGRPMSGDVGQGTAHAAVRLLESVAPHAPPGPLVLAGGTNGHTLELVRRLARRRGGGSAAVAGVAFGGVARRQLQPLLLEAQARGHRLLDDSQLLPKALELARKLVDPWLCRPGPEAG